VLEKTDAICIHALPSLLHYTIALNEGVDPIKLGLSKDSNLLTSSALIRASLTRRGELLFLDVEGWSDIHHSGTSRRLL